MTFFKKYFNWLFVASRKKNIKQEVDMNITLAPYKKIQIADFPELFFGMPVKQFDKCFPGSKNLPNGIASVES